ncbi:helix-turn-helix domain-containing protein [Nostoc sp. MS1]|uniref:helix-turn-helix domain-containing protein n=1 Tax=Nostoc sp. MS1 TaxID=2764711 RepID=UPI001CC34A76|nr:helix-turn-helix domain-containing protein [Nostoc sp. MS1]BCL38962.1 hypothetical protein NSMS1_54090 [Nostoc sp. MS1]
MTEADNNSHELLSVAQAAKLLGVSRQRVHDLIKNGQILACKLGRYYYIEHAEVDRYKNQPTGKPYQPRTTTVITKSIDNCQ